MRTWLTGIAMGLAVLLGGQTMADTVYLDNGKTFEEVIAEETETQVRIRIAGGQITLPRSKVLRVEKSVTSLELYLRTKEGLSRSDPAQAREWLDLALWARARGLEQGFREAALIAAELDPQLEGLAPVLRQLGYVLDPELGHWIPYGESMRRQGYVFYDGTWMTPEERTLRVRLREQDLAERRARAEAAEQTRLLRDIALLTLAELELTRESLRAAPPVPPLGYGLPVAIFPGGFFFHGDPHHPVPKGHRGPHLPSVHPQGHPGDHHPSAQISIFTRQPGSLIPVRRHHGRFRLPGGSE